MDICKPVLALTAVERRGRLSAAEFEQEYLKPLKPVVLTEVMSHWPATMKWTVAFFKEHYGHLMVPVVSRNFSRPGKTYLEPDRYILFREYLDILESGPSDLRIFLWNIFRQAPELRRDFSFPTLMDGFVNEVPFLFFGCAGSRVALHYDLDLSHVFLNQFHGHKRVILFPPDQGRHLYHMPFTVASHVDLSQPDFERYPALKYARGQEVVLAPGETLFIPRGYWHYIEYLDGGYSMSLRAFESVVYRLQGLASITRNYALDKLLNRVAGERWYEYKTRLAHRPAEKTLAEEATL